MSGADTAFLKPMKRNKRKSASKNTVTQAKYSEESKRKSGKDSTRKERNE